MTAPHHNWPHRQVRQRIAPTVRPDTPCALCGLPLNDSTRGAWPRWDLAHNDSQPGTYAGPAHPRCNRSAHAQSPRAKGRVGTRRRTTIATDSSGISRRISAAPTSPKRKRGGER